MIKMQDVLDFRDVNVAFAVFLCISYGGIIPVRIYEPSCHPVKLVKVCNFREASAST